MKLLIGQAAILLIILGGLFLGLLNFQDSFKISMFLFTWTIIFIPLLFWTRSNPQKAFLIATIFYAVSAILRGIFLGGEHLISLFLHLYFILSLIVGVFAKE